MIFNFSHLKRCKSVMKIYVSRADIDVENDDNQSFRRKNYSMRQIKKDQPCFQELCLSQGQTSAAKISPIAGDRGFW